jgi:hypothetical protein
MGLEGAPNFLETATRKSASRCASHLQKALQAAQLIRAACIAADEPTTPMLPPQFEHARGSWTRNPMSGDDDEVAGIGSNKFSCIDVGLLVSPHLHGEGRPSKSMP